ncbi:MAG: hypothetical protein QM652_10420 [Legionella sp.]|uniref:hypothetical protein n=1 Tax=Legionella sp. TaxID=459 RepID=UPI0039E6655A
MISLVELFSSFKIETFNSAQLSEIKQALEHYYMDESLKKILNELKTATEPAGLITSNWLAAITNLENLVVLFSQLPLEKIDILCQHLGAKLKKNYVREAEDYIFLLGFLSCEKQNIVAKHFININNLLKNRGPETNLLALLLRHVEVLDVVLDLLSEEQFFEAVTTKDQFGQTILHYLVCAPEHLVSFLEVLPENKRLEAVRIKNSLGKTILHNVVEFPELLKAIFELLKKDIALLQELVRSCKSSPTQLKKLKDHIDKDHIDDVSLAEMFYSIEHPYIDFLYSTTVDFTDSARNTIRSLYSSSSSFFSSVHREYSERTLDYTQQTLGKEL